MTGAVIGISILPMTITRQQAIDLYGSVIELAKALGYASRHAVYMWDRDNIPETPYMKLRYELKPEAFRADGSLRARAKAANACKGAA